MARLLIVILVILALLGVVWMFWGGNATDVVIDDVNNTNDTENPDRDLYNNATYAYSLTYPTELDIREVTAETATIGRLSGTAITSVADVRVLTASGTPGSTLQDAITDEMQTRCDTDGPTESFTCVGVDSTQSFRTLSGEQGFLFYLDGERTNLSTQATSSVSKGPYFAIPLDTSATASSVLVIHAPLSQDASNSDAATIRSIAESVVLNEATTTPSR